MPHKGYKQTQEHIEKCRQSKLGEKHPRYGKHWSEKYKEISRQANTGKNSHKWKGDNVGYLGLHGWIRRHKPKPDLCEECGLIPPYDAANISGEYRRDINDFRWLCRKCHVLSDGRIKYLELGCKTRIR